jgi:hypothetical protein
MAKAARDSLSLASVAAFVWMICMAARLFA